MKKLNLFLLMLVFMVNAMPLFSADSKEVSIQTNLHCGSCASKIEKGLKKTSGVLEAKSNVEDKVVTIKYNPDETDESKIKRTIKKLGYTADVLSTKSKSDCCDADKKTSSKSSGKDCCDTKATKSAPKK